MVIPAHRASPALDRCLDAVGRLDPAALVVVATVADNVRFFRDFSDEAVRRAGCLAHLDAEIEALPDGYDANAFFRDATALSGLR